MSRAFLLTLLASAALAAPAAHGQKFLNRSLRDWFNDLNNSNVDVRRGAAFALGKIGAEGDTAKVVDALTRRLGDPTEDAVVKDIAASGLGDVMTALGPPSIAYWTKAGPALQQALKDKAPSVRRSAAYGLGAFGDTAAPARDDLITALDDQAAIVRQNAAWALGKLGKEAGAEGVARLRDVLKDDEPLVRRDALHALGEVGNPTAHIAVPAMMKAAGEEKDAVVRKAAVEALSKLVGPDDRADAPSLYPLLQDKDPETRYNAAIVLGTIGGSEALPALPALRQALSDEDPHFQELAAAAIGGLGKDGAPAVADLGKALTEAKAPEVRRNAALALAHIGPASAKALPQILQALQYNDADAKYNGVRLFAGEALDNIHMPGVEPAVPAVLKMLRADPDPMVRQRCLWSLFDVQDLDHYQITPILIDLLDEKGAGPVSLLRYDAARFLALRLRENAPDRTTDVLLEMLGNTDLVQFKQTDAKTSGVGGEGTGGKTTVNVDQGGDARWMAAQALGWLGRKANRPDVVKALQEAAQSKDANLRSKAMEALGRIR